MEWIQTEQKTKEVVEKEPFKPKSKQQNPAVMRFVQGRDAAYHGIGNFITRNIDGRSTESRALRPERAFLREEPVVQCAREQSSASPGGRLRLSGKAKSRVAEVRPHASFLAESYNRAARRGREEERLIQWVSEQEIKVLDSEMLRKSLHLAGVRDSNNWSSDPNIGYEISNQAHHIVEAHDSHADTARTILQKAGIYINSAANGVFLPSEHIDGTGDATIHLGSHVQEYAKCVNESLRKAVEVVKDRQLYRENVLSRLSEIRRVLLTRNVPINKNVDPDYAEKPRGVITITDIFKDEGLFDPL